MTIAAGEIVRSERLDLPLMEPDLLDALIDDHRATIDATAGYDIPATFPDAEQREFLRFRRGQLLADPARYPWSLRAIVLRSEGRMIGYVNFHGAPGVNDTNTDRAVELGWTVFDADQKRGYATETAIALMAWAAEEHGIRHFISSTTPENTASLRVHEKLGFARTGEFIDGEVIFDLRR